MSLAVTDLTASIAFYKALGFEQNMQFSDDASACMVWSEAIQAMLSLSLDSREAVDRMNEAAAKHGGRADVNAVQDLGFRYGRDLADPDDHLWIDLRMDSAAMPLVS